MADAGIIMPFVRAWEGGTSNDKADRGGLTKWGVTLATWQRYARAHRLSPSASGLQLMTSAQWEGIFTEYYWTPSGAGRLSSQPVANMLADFAWHSGPAQALKSLQRLVGTTADGIFGPATLAAVEAAPACDLFHRYREARLAFVEALARRDKSQEKFLAGWRRRIKSIQYDRLMFP